MATQNFEIPNLFVAGRLSLDFVNTACERRGTPLEFLGSPVALQRWLQVAAEVSGKQLGCGDELSDAESGQRMLDRAIGLRTDLDALVRSVIEKEAPPAEALDAVNRALRATSACSQLSIEGPGFRESMLSGHPGDQWLFEIARDAVDLLCHSDLSLLRRCECPSCVRVFYDITKNHKRRWCVEKCGSQSKAAAYYRRKKARAELLKTSAG